MNKNTIPLLGFIILLFLTATKARSEEPAQEKKPAVRLLTNIDVGEFGSEQLRIGDLDGDGGPDLLLVQSEYASRSITCLTALTIEGKVLWQVGTPSLSNGRIYSDLPVQIYDWDDDGENEVLYVKQAKYLEPWNITGMFPASKTRERAAKYEGSATLIVLNGKSGMQEQSFPIPSAADDCFLLADLTGRGRRGDLVVKDRYWNAWGIAHDGKELWHWSGSTGHFPAVADIDDDGKDEVFFGYTLLDHDGSVLFSNDPNTEWSSRFQQIGEKPTKKDYQRLLSTPIHSDANCIVRLASGQLRLYFGNSGPHCMQPDGKELWSGVQMGEAQHVVAGRFRRDSEIQLAIIDRTPTPDARKKRETAVADFYLFDLNGKQLWKQPQQPGDWMIGCTSVAWRGPKGLEDILVYGRSNGQPSQLINGEGKVVTEFEMLYKPDRRSQEPEAWSEPLGIRNYYVLCADVWGDARDEVILFGARGLCIYTNPRPLADPTQYNETLYTGM